MSNQQDYRSSKFIDGLTDRMKDSEEQALRGSGSSDVLYDSRVQAAYASILDSAPESEKQRAEEILRERGYDPDFTPYEAAEGECDLTGIEIDCCPCGRHP